MRASAKPVVLVGDLAFCPADSHGCPACAHPVLGPAIQGDCTVSVAGLPIVRVTDQGIHAACCGSNTWKVANGSPGVMIGGLKVARIGDPTEHCGGDGFLITGFGAFLVGNKGNQPGCEADDDDDIKRRQQQEQWDQDRQDEWDENHPDHPIILMVKSNSGTTKESPESVTRNTTYI